MVFTVLFSISMDIEASVRMDALGKYFSFIIPDVETDIEEFPTHLNEFEKRFIQFKTSTTKYIIYNFDYHYYSNPKINLSVLPLLGKFSYKFDVGVSAYNIDNVIANFYQPRINRYKYDEYDLRDNKTIYLINYLSYEFSLGFSLGTYFRYDQEWVNENDFRDYNRDYYPDDYSQEIRTNLEDINIHNFETGFNIHFGKDIIKDISFKYKNTKNDFEENQIRYRYSDHYYDDEQNTSESNNLSGYLSDEKIQCYGSSILIGKYENDSFRRFYCSVNYSDESFFYDRSSEDERCGYENEVLENHDIRTESSKADIVRKLYNGSAGYGTNSIFNKWELLYGLKFAGSYSDYKSIENYESYALDESFYADSTVVEENTESYSTFSFAKEYLVSMELPIGITYKINKKIRIFGGLGFKISKRKLKFDNEDDFNSWQTANYHNLGVELNPIEKLQIGINFSESFTDYKYWKIDVKYFF